MISASEEKLDEHEGRIQILRQKVSSLVDSDQMHEKEINGFIQSRATAEEEIRKCELSAWHSYVECVPYPR